MLWRSVVGKLWLTILVLVSVVLLFLTTLLLQFFEDYDLTGVEGQMKNAGSKVAEIMGENSSHDQAIKMSKEIIDAFHFQAVILKGHHTENISSNDQIAKDPKAKPFLNDKELSKVINNNQTVAKQGEFPALIGSKKQSEVMVVGVPIPTKDGPHSAVFVFQSLNAVQETINQAKKIVYITAGIAIILTTVFAFFLSTRITAPLRKMREAVIQVAKGKFDTKVPVVSNDEIGELAHAFNRMARELKTNITALNQEKEQLSGILSSMADGVMTFDRDGHLLITNPPAERFVKASNYERGTDSSEKDMLPSEIKELFSKVVSLEKEQATEITFQGRSWVILMAPLYNQSIVRGAVAVLRDMTEERQMDELRKGFIANVSHELRTPIAMLQGYSEAIIDDIAESPEEKKEIAQIIYEESLRMGRLVNELLDLARMEAGHFQLNATDIRANEFFERVVRKFNGLAKEQEVALKYEGLDQEKTVYFDPDRIEQVITNLVDNALRHTGSGGSVTVKAESFHEGLRLLIIDTGSGISKEDLPFVFERFYKADKARTRGKSGTGLGLAIAKNIVQAHEGDISVYSKEGEGTTYTIFLPRKFKKI